MVGSGVVVYFGFFYCKTGYFRTGAKGSSPHTGNVVAKMVEPMLRLLYIRTENYLVNAHLKIGIDTDLLRLAG